MVLIRSRRWPSARPPSSPGAAASRALLRLAAPVLDLVLAVGDRVSRVAGRDEPEPEPPRRSLRAELRTPLGAARPG